MKRLAARPHRLPGPSNGTAGTTSAGERVLHHGATVLVTASGAGLFAMKYLLPAPEDPFVAVGHPLQPQVLHLHVLAGPVALLAVGMMLRDHILGRLRNPTHTRNRCSGALAAWLLLPMIASGYLLQTAQSELWRVILVWLHLGSGGLYATAYVAHLVTARRHARRLRELQSVAEGPPGEGLHLRAARPPEGRRRGGGVPVSP